MSMELNPVPPVDLGHAEPATAVKHVIPELPTTVDPTETATPSVTTGIELALKLSEETVTQLQVQAEAGDQPAIAELARRAMHKQLESSESNAHAAAPTPHVSAEPHEPGKGTQIDEMG